MSSAVSCLEWANSVLEPATPPWYALTTLSRHEWLVTKQLQSHGLEPFLPIRIEIHRWSDRRKKVEVPLFPGYVFLHANMCGEIRHTIQRLRGCGGFITMHGDPVPIPEEQISGIQKILDQRVPCTTYSCLTIGHRVRVRGGSLDGIEGILLRKRGENSLVISVDSIGRSVAIRIEGYAIEQL